MSKTNYIHVINGLIKSIEGEILEMKTHIETQKSELDALRVMVKMLTEEKKCDS